GDANALRQQVAPGAFRVPEPMFLRIRTPQTAVETPGMAGLLPEEAFPPPGEVRDLRTPDGRSFRLRTDRVESQGLVGQAALDRTDDEELLTDYRWQLVYALAASLVVCTAGGYRI